MPLPEHEQRQLQEIEQALCRDDPKFARFCARQRYVAAVVRMALVAGVMTDLVLVRFT